MPEGEGETPDVAAVWSTMTAMICVCISSRRTREPYGCVQNSPSHDRRLQKSSSSFLFSSSGGEQNGRPAFRAPRLAEGAVDVEAASRGQPVPSNAVQLLSPVLD